MLHHDIPALKARVPMRVVVEAFPGAGRDPAIGADGKVSCPFHDDRHPSCHLYPDGFTCFGCGAYGDAIDWLEQVGGFTTAEAIERLAALAERAPPPVHGRGEAPRPRVRDRSHAALGGRVVDRWRRLLERTRRLPAALRGRGLAVEDARTLGIAARGDDALIPIVDPEGRLVALKRRHAAVDSGGRYSYLAGGHGTPAWCSPRALSAPVVFVVEGELNGMVAHLALREAGLRVGVIGVAGVHGEIPAAPLKDADVLLWSDADEAGARALQRWMVAARRAGARSVRALPRAREDACDFAERRGRSALARALVRAMLRASYDPSENPGPALGAEEGGNDADPTPSGGNDTGRDDDRVPVVSR